MKKTFLFGALLGAAALLSPESKAQNTLDYNAWVSGSNRGAPYNDFSVNTQDRAAVGSLWTQVYRPMTGMPTGLSGNTGSFADTFQWATVSRLNYFRAMAGVETRIVPDPTWNARIMFSGLVEDPSIIDDWMLDY